MRYLFRYVDSMTVRYLCDDMVSDVVETNILYPGFSTVASLPLLEPLRGNLSQRHTRLSGTSGWAERCSHNTCFALSFKPVVIDFRLLLVSLKKLLDARFAE